MALFCRPFRKLQKAKPNVLVSRSLTTSSGDGYAPYFLEGSDPEKMHEILAATLDGVLDN
jgi:hypothetical protein